MEWERVRDREEGTIEKEWGRFKGVVLRCSKEVCGSKLRKKSGVWRRSEWWSEE